ncbi:MAG: hypothetical protein Q4F65_10195, partial [Propionibacteriaceae bacterium]|nr:hypothetical protein [Propionibacteriaceae bacterium]
MRTRPRHFLIGVLAAALVLVGVPLPAHAETATPPVEQGDTPLERVASLPDAPAEVAGAGGVIALAEAAITGPTAVAGLTWDHDDEVSQAYYRFVTDGVPQEWVEIHAHHDHDHPGEDADRTPAEAEEPHSHGTPAIIITGADAVQVATVSSRPVSSSLFVASSPEVPADAEAAADASGEATGEA